MQTLSRYMAWRNDYWNMVEYLCDLFILYLRYGVEIWQDSAVSEHAGLYNHVNYVDRRWYKKSLWVI